MSDRVPTLLTVGVIADELGVPLHRVLYVLKTRPHIRVRALAGRARLFRDDAVEQVRHELDSIEAQRMWSERTTLIQNDVPAPRGDDDGQGERR